MLSTQSRRLFWRCLVLSCLFISNLYAQSIRLEDYQRARDFTWPNINNKLAFNLQLTAGFYPDSSGLWFVDYGPDQKTFYEVLFDPTNKALLFDHQRLVDSLQLILEDTVLPHDLPFDGIEYVDEEKLKIRLNGNTYDFNRKTYQLTVDTIKPKEPNIMESRSPDGKWIAFAKDYNLFINSTETDEVIQLSADGAKDYEYATYFSWNDIIEGENGERPAHFQVHWSPDSKWLRTQVCDYRKAEKMYLLDYRPNESHKAKLRSYYRASSGDSALLGLQPVIYDIDKKQEIANRPRKFAYVHPHALFWIPGREQALIVERERGFKQLNFVKYDLPTGKRDLLFAERSSSWIGRALGVYFFEHANKFIFLSERSGWQHLYAYDLERDTIQALTSGAFIVHQTIYRDFQNGWIYFLASGMDRDNIPYHQYLYRVSIHGGEMECLTPELGNHHIRFSPDGRFFIDEYSTFKQPAIFSLRASQDGQIVTELTQTNISLLKEKGWSPPEGFTALARDDSTTIYGTIWKPSHFDPNKKYPIIDQSYTGPNRNVFPRRFSMIFYDALHDLAELGFIVVKIDGMGTYGRSKAFHTVSYRNMGNNLEDHVLAIRELADKHPWVDTNRVGIHGHSAGGYDAVRGLLQYSDFYKVGVASSGNHDYRLANAWWPELYMGWPVDSAYDEASNLSLVNKLKGKLLLAHGGLDDNVNPATTYGLVEALIKADKNFDMLILPGRDHAYWGYHGAYFQKRRWNYFVEHLLGAKPLWDIP